MSMPSPDHGETYWDCHIAHWKSREFGMYQRGPFLDALVIAALETFFGGIARMKYEDRIEREWAQRRADIAYRDYLVGVPG